MTLLTPARKSADGAHGSPMPNADHHKTRLPSNGRGGTIGGLHTSTNNNNPYSNIGETNGRFRKATDPLGGEHA